MEDLLNDPDMKDIVDEFCNESNGLLDELEEILDELEDDPMNSALMEKFGQVIDRIMGAAQTIGANTIGTFCQLGKTIGYKASQVKDEELLNTVVAILFDAVELLKSMIKKIEAGEAASIDSQSTQAFGSRLKWLSDKFKDIDRSSVAVEKVSDGGSAGGQEGIDDLMDKMKMTGS